MYILHAWFESRLTLRRPKTQGHKRRAQKTKPKLCSLQRSVVEFARQAVAGQAAIFGRVVHVDQRRTSRRGFEHC